MSARSLRFFACTLVLATGALAQGYEESNLTPAAILGAWQAVGPSGEQLWFEEARCTWKRGDRVLRYRARYDTGRVLLERGGQLRQHTFQVIGDKLFFETGGLLIGFARLDRVPPGFLVEPIRLGSSAPSESDRRAVSNQLVRQLESTDTKGSPLLRGLVEHHGWIDPSRFGEEAAGAAFVLLVQSGDLPLALAALPELERMTRDGDFPARNFAQFCDRVQLDLGRSQRYGTQLATAIDGRLRLLPIAERDSLEERRAAIGLEPHADYLQSVQATENTEIGEVADMKIAELDMEQLEWRKRPLLLFAPDARLSGLQAMNARLLAAGVELADRDMTVITVAGFDGTVDGSPLPAKTVGDLRERFEPDPERLTIVLVGKDGGEKLREHEPIPLSRIFGLVDSMPMRRREMRERDGK